MFYGEPDRDTLIFIELFGRSLHSLHIKLIFEGDSRPTVGIQFMVMIPHHRHN